MRPAANQPQARSGHPLRAVLILGAVGLTAGAAGSAAAVVTPRTEVVSVRPDGQVSVTGGGNGASMSDDGRFVAFWGYGSDLAPGDGNNTPDVFVRDRKSGTTELISVRADGGGSADRFSYGPSISATGRFVAFASEATNLVDPPLDPPGGNPFIQVYLRDRKAGTTRLVSVDAAGADPANGYCGSPSVSADGRYVVFPSSGTNLVAEDTNSSYDIFVRDMKLGVTRLVSVRASGGGPANAAAVRSVISANGRYVAFESSATDLTADAVTSTQVYVRDLRKRLTRLVSVRSGGGGGGNGESSTPHLTADGRFVAFESRATDLVGGSLPDTNDADDAFVRDLRRRVTVLATPNAAGTATADRYSEEACVSGSGRWVVFYSYATDLVATPHDGNEHVYLRDIQRRRTTLLTVNAAGTGPADGGSYRPRITPSGRWAAWDSSAPDLVEGDTNRQDDVFVRRLR